MSTFVKGGGGAGEKVKIDGVKVANKMELTSYKGANPLTIGQAGVAFPANTLFLEDFDILNGVNGEDLTDTVADQTTAVEELMKMVNRKIAMNNGEGQYVWKKSEYEQVLASEIIVTQIQGGGIDACIIKFSSDKIDFSTIDNSFFVGMKLTYTGPRVVNLYANNVAGFESSTSGHSWTWNPSTQQMSFSFTGSSNVTWAITSPASFGVKNITGYVVSNDAEAYPDGGEQDGYWYELMSTSSGIDFGKVTLTATATNITVQHNLKVAPSQAILIELGDFTNSTARTSFAIDNGKSELVQSTNGGNPSNTTNTIALTSTEISFDSYSSIYKYVAGAYLWIAVA